MDRGEHRSFQDEVEAGGNEACLTQQEHRFAAVFVEWQGALKKKLEREQPRGETEAERLRDVFQIVGPSDATEVLIDDRPVPYARELWLPLVWFLLPR